MQEVRERETEGVSRNMVQIQWSEMDLQTKFGVNGEEGGQVTCGRHVSAGKKARRRALPQLLPSALSSLCALCRQPLLRTFCLRLRPILLRKLLPPFLLFL